MLIGISLMILVVLTLFSLVLGEEFISVSEDVFVDNSALVNGTITTFEVELESFIFEIDPLIGGIAIIITITTIATLVGGQFLGSGLSPASVRVIIMVAGYVGLWGVLSILVIDLIKSIAVFGSIIYITITLAYTIGVVQKVGGGDD